MSEEKTLEVLSDFANALEAVSVKLKHDVAALAQRKESQVPADNRSLGKLEPELDFSKLFWEQKQGEKGPFEQTSEKANGNSDLWKVLKAKLKANNGFWQNQGYRLWFDMKNESVIDRRKV